MPVPTPSRPADFQLISAWLSARSVARGLPAPVPEFGGLRIDTLSDREVQRWVFTQVTPGLIALGTTICEPRHFIKLCAPGEVLMEALPPAWRLQPSHCVMVAAKPWPHIGAPTGYCLETVSSGAVTHVRVLDQGGLLAASGYAAETADVFVYDRIETAPGHGRKGLGSAVMSALSAAKRSPATVEILVATDDGRRLYKRFGWRVISAYSTATIP